MPKHQKYARLNLIFLSLYCRETDLLQMYQLTSYDDEQ